MCLLASSRSCGTFGGVQERSPNDWFEVGSPKANIWTTKILHSFISNTRTRSTNCVVCETNSMSCMAASILSHNQWSANWHSVHCCGKCTVVAIMHAKIFVLLHFHSIMISIYQIFQTRHSVNWESGSYLGSMKKNAILFMVGGKGIKNILMWNQDSVVGIMNRLWTGYLRNHGLTPGRGVRFFFLHKNPDQVLGSPSLLFIGYWRLSLQQ